MSKQTKINTAQQILYALGVTFPLYSQMHVDKSLTSTKKGPGRRHLQGRTTPFAERLRAVVHANTTHAADGEREARNGAFWTRDKPSVRRGDWGYGARNGVVYTRGWLQNWPLFAAKGI